MTGGAPGLVAEQLLLADQLQPDVPGRLFRLADAQRREGRLAEAISALSRYLGQKPDDLNARTNLGAIQFQLGQLNDSLASFQQVLAQDPAHSGALVNFGNTLRRLGRLHEAETAYRKVLALLPEAPDVLVRLANTLQEAGQAEEATALYRRALAASPDSLAARASLAFALVEQGEYSEALDLVRRLVTGPADGIPSAGPASTMPVTALMALGRSGSLFFHSLFDGHPGITSLPGVYFKGWFGADGWDRCAPHPGDPDWRRKLLEAIDLPFGRLFGERDLVIFETLFWPFLHRFAYSKMDAAEFRCRLKEIRPWLDEPLQFENVLFSAMPEPRPDIKTLLPFIQLHGVLKNYWAILNRDGTYQFMPEPIKID